MSISKPPKKKKKFIFKEENHLIDSIDKIINEVYIHQTYYQTYNTYDFNLLHNRFLNLSLNFTFFGINELL